mmetsp:Transcript_10604/g.11659  ORF Transcript_10604/g.11659 Transcript_10604/m.11659 type:complete len:511 (+) Transcript_10604:83-1615(+)
MRAKKVAKLMFVIQKGKSKKYAYAFKVRKTVYLETWVEQINNARRLTEADLRQLQVDVDDEDSSYEPLDSPSENRSTLDKGDARGDDFDFVEEQLGVGMSSNSELEKEVPVKRLPEYTPCTEPTWLNNVLHRVFLQMASLEVFHNFIKVSIDQSFESITPRPAILGEMHILEFNWGTKIFSLKNTKADYLQTGELVVETDIDYRGSLSAVLSIVLKLRARRLKVVATVTVKSLVGTLHILMPEDINGKWEMRLVRKPEFDLNVEITAGGRRLPQFKSLLHRILTKVVNDYLVYPKGIRMYIPFPGIAPEVEIMEGHKPTRAITQTKEASRRQLSSASSGQLATSSSAAVKKPEMPKLKDAPIPEDKIRQDTPDAIARKYHLKMFISRAVNLGDLEIIDELFLEECNVHGVLPINVILHGRAAIKKFVVELRTAFPDLSFTIADEVAWQSYCITARYVAKGTHKRPLWDYQPSGVERILHGVVMLKFDKSNQNVTEFWNFINPRSLYKLLN